MTSSLAPPTLSLFFWPSPTHPSLLFFRIALPTLFRPFSEDFPKIFPKMTSSSEIWSQVSHDVSLMNFLSIFLHLQLIDISSDDFQQPIRSRPFPKIFPKIGRRCSPPIRSQEICEICHLRLIWSNLSHSTTSV